MKKAFVAFGVIALVFTSCKENKTEKTEVVVTQDTAKNVKNDTIAAETVIKKTTSIKSYGEINVQNRIFNDFARYIAGMPLEDGSSLAKVAQYESYKTFQTAFDSSWKKVDENRYSKMRAWADTELVELRAEPKNILYPFSGPDFVNVFTFFPNGKTYVLLALEPVGEYVDFTNQSEKEVDQYLASVDNALNDLFKKSYFITMHMIGDLHKAKGVYPLTSLFMARTGNKILNVQRVKFDSSGAVITDSLLSRKLSKKVNAIKIDFVNENDPDNVKTLFYIRGDMSDNGCKANKGVMKFLQTFDNSIGYFKSASYLCHMRDFDTIRNLMLDQCDYIVQDDTGIAYRFFKQSQWKLQLYGKYAKPVKDFSGVDQEDLRKAYKASKNVEPLPFSLGYHWGTQNQNLMKAVKIK